MQRSAEVYAEIPLADFIDERRRNELARALFLEINAVINSPDPVSSCRDRLVTTMLKLASLQVLVVPPRPDADPSGLRGQPGISGELKRHIPALCLKDDDLRDITYKETGSDSFDDLWPVVQRHYWEAYWYVQTLNGLRLELGDFVEGDDWYVAFLHAACVKAEHIYRFVLELPPAFDEAIARDASTAYSVFTDIVLAGAENPLEEWRDYHRGLPLPMPDFRQHLS